MPRTASRWRCRTRGLSALPDQKDVVVEALRRLRPRVVLLQHWLQRHPDHAAASRIVYDASFLAGLRNYRPDLGLPFRPTKLVYAATMTEANDIRPSFVVDVTAVWETKIKAIAAFASQFTPGPGETGAQPLDRFREAVELTGRRHGQQIGVRFGEGFVTKEPLAVDDVAALAGARRSERRLLRRVALRSCHILARPEDDRDEARCSSFLGDDSHGAGRGRPPAARRPLAGDHALRDRGLVAAARGARRHADPGARRQRRRRRDRARTRPWA